MRYTKYFILTILVILIDQIIKLWVFKTFPFEGYEHPSIRLGDWFKLHYITNEGMAFGIKIAGNYGKLILSLFRLVAMGVITIYLYKMAKKEMHEGFLWCVALILGGAMGNVVDSTFYGVFLNLPTYDAPMLWFHGRVIDMFYVDICNCLIPEWVPGIGGSYYPLWPIFNFADATIFVGVALILIFQKRYFPEEVKVVKKKKEEEL